MPQVPAGGNADAPALAPERSAGASVGPAEVREHCAVDAAGKSLLRAAMQQLQMSARAYHRILKLARTLADLVGSTRIEAPHVAEAIQYRPRRMLSASVHLKSQTPASATSMPTNQACWTTTPSSGQPDR